MKNTTSLRLVRTAVLVFPGCVPSAAVLPADVFTLANRVLSAGGRQPAVRFEAAWIGARGPGPVHVGALSLGTGILPQADALIVPGIEHQDGPDLARALAMLLPERDWLAAHAADYPQVLASCSAVALLAETGLLDGCRVTSSWWLAPALQARHPSLRLDERAMLVEDGRWVTAAGIGSYQELALWVVAHWGGADLARRVAKLLLRTAPAASQTPFVERALLEPRRPSLLERAEAWLNEHLAQSWRVVDLAAHCHVSPRTLQRRFQQHLGTGPLQHAQRLRVERAKVLLEGTDWSFERITEACGYADAASFAKAFKRRVELTPQQYRRRFAGMPAGLSPAPSSVLRPV